jgi:hypothetical protein
MEHATTSHIYGSIKRVRLWSEEKLLEWTLDTSKMLLEAELKSLIAAQFGRTASMYPEDLSYYF